MYLCLACIELPPDVIMLAGFETLQDCLDWISCNKKLELARLAQVLVQDYQEKFCPVISLNDMAELPGQYASMASQFTVKGKRLLVAMCDFNVPGVS